MAAVRRRLLTRNWSRRHFGHQTPDVLTPALSPAAAMGSGSPVPGNTSDSVSSGAGRIVGSPSAFQVLKPPMRSVAHSRGTPACVTPSLRLLSEQPWP
jgi:hypothetical protein